MEAASNGLVEVARALLDHGAATDAFDVVRWTTHAGHAAARREPSRQLELAHRTCNAESRSAAAVRPWE